MTSEEYCQIWLPAALKIYHANKEAYKGFSVWDMSIYFDNLLGCTEFEEYTHELAIGEKRSDKTPLPEHIKKLLEALAGPHSEVVLKVLELRRGAQK